MNIYTMKMTEGSGGKPEPSRIKEFVFRKQLVGSGYNTSAFSTLHAGDVVVLRTAGAGQGLLEVTGPVSDATDSDKSDFEDDFGWLRKVCPVSVLDWGDDKRINFRSYMGTFGAIHARNDDAMLWMQAVRGQNMLKQFTAALSSSKNMVLSGAPGTGKTYLARQIAAEMLGCGDDELSSNERFGFVQFHPAYDYTDFVEGLKPVKNGDTIGFELRDGVFREFCGRAKERAEEPFVFVIDEINRGDLSRVFGELFFALDPSYRGKIGAVTTQYATLRGNETFYVPDNVYLIGTMNDIDRSVESIDFALRRRFAWYEVEADDARFDTVMANVLQDRPETKADARLRYARLNAKISDTDGLGSSYRIGPAYYLKLGAYLGETDNIWRAFWTHHLSPLIREYLRGMNGAKLEEFESIFLKE